MLFGEGGGIGEAQWFSKWSTLGGMPDNSWRMWAKNIGFLLVFISMFLMSVFVSVIKLT